MMVFSREAAMKRKGNGAAASAVESAQPVSARRSLFAPHCRDRQNGLRRSGIEQKTFNGHAMNKPFFATLISVVMLGAGLSPASAFAHDLDEQFTCKSSAHAFISRLISDQSIEPSPMLVEANSVNAFKPRHDAGLTAFGLRVRAVFGYQPGDPMFKPGNGKTPSGPIYGAVVFGSTDSVEALVRQAGSHAAIHQVIPLMLSAIVCES
ncbi:MULTISPECIES: hypothetical protein [Burkholderia]|jgi:hypothetical protein|nr:MULTISPECIES: hypothetical protein [Burkholderia]MCA7890093.1 hypothetical protein [Burkholderia contaminans]MCA8211683.1 hypothetical protein [Burkholderia vietnamiensis]MDN7670568.1 hypothetical protein [Burkholderia vietnamiensis]MDN7844613.1 hypothetical protein [Burkholderia multivorans]UKD18006.1 hypothetical protein L3V59_44050 [Burkholderia aenigmatica]